MECRCKEWAPFFLRVALGLIFLHHGGEKVFSNGPYAMAHGPHGFIAAGWPLPHLLSVLASFGEFLGGLFVILGAGTRFGAFLIACVMAVATFAVHLPKDGFLSHPFEFALALLAAALALMLLGGGAASIDGLVWRRLHGAPTLDEVAPARPAGPAGEAH